MEKNLDRQGRWRNRTVAFRVSEEEAQLIDRLVAISGMTKQDYVLFRLTGRDIVVHGNPRVYKALRDQMRMIHEELIRIKDTSELSEGLMILIKAVAQTMEGMKNECIAGKEDANDE